MLTEVKAYSSWQSAPALSLSDNGRAETDLIQLRNIDGLNPVKASVSTAPYGSIDGTAYIGSSVQSRNIVLTLHPNPNWDTWSHESLRRLIYAYFMPKRPVTLQFYSDDMVPVKIEGYVEDVAVNQFSSDPEILVSIICPDPYFSALEPEVVSGEAVRAGGAIAQIDYNGTVEGGILVEVTHVSTPVCTLIGVQIGDPTLSYFDVKTTVNTTKYFRMSSVPTQKFVELVTFGGGDITNLLSKVTVREGSAWPMLQPGENNFSVITDTGEQNWELTYYERFGGL